MERLLQMGGRAQHHQIVGCAPAADAQSSRCSDVIELEPTEAVVGDPQPAKDAASVAPPDVCPHRRRDRVRPPDALRSPMGGVAAEHG
jgi:hypothetical protein